MCLVNQIGLVSVCAKFQLSSWSRSGRKVCGGVGMGGGPLGQRGQLPPQSGSNLQIRNGILVLIMFIFQVYTVVVWWIRVITYSLISRKVKELTTQVWNIQNNVTLTFLSTLEYVSAVVN